MQTGFVQDIDSQRIILYRYTPQKTSDSKGSKVDTIEIYK